MPRVVKRPDVRKSELLDCAQTLFFERGYERTTINHILDAAGVSKGGFYHHFSSKEELLEALAARISQESIAQYAGAPDGPEVGALKRLNRFFADGRQVKIDSAPRLQAAFKVLIKPENLALHHRVHSAVMAVVAPALARIIAQGKGEGVFDISDPMAAAETILQLSASTREAMARVVEASGEAERATAWAAFDARLRFQGVVVDRILGLPDGSVVYVQPGLEQAVFEWAEDRAALGGRGRGATIQGGSRPST